MPATVVLARLKNYLNIVTPPLGLGYLLTAIRDLPGVLPVFVDAHRDRLDDDALLERLRREKPSLVGLQVYSLDYAHFRRILPRIREACPNALLVAGGAHISGLPEAVLRENPALDYAVKGEGEAALRALLEAHLAGDLEQRTPDIPNLVYRANGGVRVNPLEFPDIEACGRPAWDLIEPDKYPPIQHGTFHRSDKVVPILTSRGCPYPCTFCAGHLSTGKKVRTRSAQSVGEEASFLMENYGFRELIIEDENFTFRKEHVRAVANELERRGIHCHVSFPNGIRLDRVDEEVAGMLRRMGTYLVVLGIESGSERTLKAMRKPWDLDEVKRKIRLLQSHGILVRGSFILGFSTETLEDVEATIRYACECGADQAYFGNYLPLPGSEDFERLVEAGELDPESIDWDAYTSYHGRLGYHPPAISEEELLRAVRRVTRRFYLRPRILFGMLRQMTRPVFVRSMLFRTAELFGYRAKN